VNHALIARILSVVALLLMARLAGAAPEIDQPAPALKGTLFSGQPFDLAAMRGKVVLVNFYSSYCKQCAFEIGTLESFYEDHKAQGFEVVAIGIDAPSDRHRVERMLGIYNLPGMMADELSASGFERSYPTPTAFLIDRNGVLRAKQRGGKIPEFYREVVLPLLKE
jgi:cytochrome c biogenesis protein CcmG, thiol:disulfide interchange protein DsbE